MTETPITNQKPTGKAQPNCNVNQSFNFAVGGVALVVAVIAGYLIYVYLLKG